MDELPELKLLVPGAPALLCWGLKINDECKPVARWRRDQWTPYPELYGSWSASGRDGITVELEGHFGYRVDNHPWRAARGQTQLQLRAEPSAVAKLIVDGEVSAFFANGFWWYPNESEPGSFIELGSLSEVIIEIGQPGRLSRTSSLAEHDR